MKHFMLDAYGAEKSRLTNIKYINNCLNSLALRLGLTPVSPPFLLPYYYGIEPEDVGISSFLFLRGGHITIHTFPLRKCYFVDLFFPESFDEIKAFSLFKQYWPFEESKSFSQTIDRSIDNKRNSSFDGSQIFGPHVLARLSFKTPVDMDFIFHFLEKVINDVEMTPIIRPLVITDKIENPTYISGIAMIAESHISFHYNIKTSVVMFDIFSCKMFDFEGIKTSLLAKIAKIESFIVIPRGTKHSILKANTQAKKSISLKSKSSNSAWKDNI